MERSGRCGNRICRRQNRVDDKEHTSDRECKWHAEQQWLVSDRTDDAVFVFLVIFVVMVGNDNQEQDGYVYSHPEP